MALPWGRGSPGISLPGGEVDVFLHASGGSSPMDSFRRFFSSSSASRFPLSDGCCYAPPGASYEIEVVLRERAPSRGACRVVRATIGGTEVNEQLVLLSGTNSSARFVGWLQDDTGAKRIRFTAPSSDREELIIQIAVFAATECSSAKGKERATSAPASAIGESFAGPLVGTKRYTIGEPVAIGSARLRADMRGARP